MKTSMERLLKLVQDKKQCVTFLELELPLVLLQKQCQRMTKTLAMLFMAKKQTVVM